jgi:hypothetical protein
MIASFVSVPEYFIAIPCLSILTKDLAMNC